MKGRVDMKKVSVLIPCYNEKENVIPMSEAIDNIFKTECSQYDYELLFIDNDSTAHAEIVAIRTAESILQNYRLTDCEMFITLEPCLMCAGAIFNARLSRIVYACQDFKSGVHKSLPNFDVFFDNRLNIGNKTKIVGGICQNQSLELLQNFFKNKRSKEKI